MTPRLLEKVDLFITESRNNLGVRFSQGVLKNKHKTIKYNERSVHLVLPLRRTNKLRKLER